MLIVGGIKMKALFTIEEVAVAIGVSVQTIKNWYRFKKKFPDNEYAKFLPEPEILGKRHQKVWDKSSIDALRHYKNIIPKGRNGVMGEITQRYIKRKQV